MILSARTKLFGLFLGILFLAKPAQSQITKCSSVTVDKYPRCANLIVEYRTLTTSKLKGRVEWPVEAPVLLEIYKIEKSDWKKNSYDLTQGRAPIGVTETDKEGRFCHPGINDGYYVLRFGSEEQGWNCTWVKVRIVKGAPERNLKVSLEIGI